MAAKHQPSLLSTALPQPMTGTLDLYLQSVKRIPLLTAEHEMYLARQVQETGDSQALHAMVRSSLRFVVHVAYGYRDCGLPYADVIQQGNLGLLKAAMKFNPAFGVRLISYAGYSIKSEIHDYVMRNCRIVRIATTKAQRKLFFGLRKRKTHAGALTSSEIHAIADELKVAPEDVREMERRFASGDSRLESSLDGVSHECVIADPQDDYEAIADAQWSTQQRNCLRQAVMKLDPRSRDILRRRWLQEDGIVVGLLELGAEYGISTERVRQIQSSALLQLRKALERDALVPDYVPASRSNRHIPSLQAA